MPWQPSNAKEKTKRADTPRKQEIWSQVANERLAKTQDEGLAIREANAVIARIPKYKQRKSK